MALAERVPQSFKAPLVRPAPTENPMDNNEGMPLRAPVIDDDRDMVKVIRVMLKVKGIQTVEAFSGLSGYAMVKREQPDIVLLDIMMPDIDGFEVLRKLRLDKETERIPIIFVSARAGREHVERGLSLGAQGYMTKPFKPDDLIAKIVDVLDLAGDSA